MKVMILAAGYGKRLLPITKETPKPLLKIGNETLLDRNIKHVLSSGFDEIIINVSHHGDKIKKHLIKNYKDHQITIIEEPHPYGTGGALVNAKDHLDDGTILIINADIFHDFDLSELNRETECIHLVGVENPDHNKDGDFNIRSDGKVFCDNINQLTWSGISLLNTDILTKTKNNNFPFDSWTSIVLPQIKEGKVTGEIYSDIWFDVGTKDRLELVNKILDEEN